jgi:N-acetylglucosamine-6-phosphate deacetylase
VTHQDLRNVPLIDLQVNGGCGVDFSSPVVTDGQIRECCRAVAAGGTAGFLATLVSGPEDLYRRNLPMLVAACQDDRLHGSVLGIHLEGPFLASDARVLGAHRAAHVRQADVGMLDQLIDLGRGCVRLITLAAELSGADELARRATARGVRVSIGHSYYDADRLRAMYQAGARALTHLGNALPADLPKQDNPLIAGLLSEEYMAMFIGDGQHLSASVLRLMMRCLGAVRLIAVSDASPVAGLPPGHYEALGQALELCADGGVYNHAERHLVGSSSSLLQIVNTLLRLGICDPDDCVRVASANPLAFLGICREKLEPNVPTVTFDPTSAAFALSQA